MAPNVRNGLKWVGRKFCPESCALLKTRGDAIGLHNGSLRDSRRNWPELSVMQKTMRAGVFAMTGVVAKTFFCVFGRGVFVGRADLMRAVERAPKEQRSLITVSNHVGTIDDPVLWGALPFSWVVFNDANRRWLWASQDICHANRYTALAFGLGHCVPIIRGAGLEQEGVEELQEKVDAAKWVHVFSEGQCNQNGEVLSFRWGVGRLVVHAAKLPRVIPFAHRGMQDMFPEHLSKAYPRFSKVRAQLGEEICVKDIWTSAQTALSIQDDTQRKSALEALYAEATNRIETATRELYSRI